MEIIFFIGNPAKFKFQFIALFHTVILSERSESTDPYSLQKGNGFFDFAAYRRLRSE
jgi:hypothetical protein